MSVELRTGLVVKVTYSPKDQGFIVIHKWQN